MIDQGELFDLPEGRRRRDEGMGSVSGHNKRWLEDCYIEARKFIASTDKPFTGEDIRFHCINTVGHPHHHNAWGALTNGLVLRGMVKKTGEHRPMKAKLSHARSTPVYVKP